MHGADAQRRRVRACPRALPDGVHPGRPVPSLPHPDRAVRPARKPAAAPAAAAKPQPQPPSEPTEPGKRNEAEHDTAEEVALDTPPPSDDPHSDKIAAMLLGLGDDAGTEQVPEGSTVLELPSM